MELVLVNQTTEESLEKYRQDFEYLADQVFQKTGRNPQSVWSVIQVNDEQIHEINREYRNIDRPTDVITFALQDTDEPELDGLEEIENELGDVFLNIDAARRQAKDYGHSVRREICFLFIHGLLHLLGYDHQTKEDEEVMFGLQRSILDAYIPFNDQVEK